MFGFFLFLLLVMAGLIAVTAGLRHLGVGARGDLAEPPSLDAAAVRRLEDAIAALDGRLDRLEDQQRFLERLLAERPPARSLPPAEEPDGAEEPRRGVDSVLFDVDRDEP